MKQILFCLFVLVVTVHAHPVAAQQLQEVVYLKNGSIIRGTIIEEIPGKSYKVQTPDGSLIICKAEDVERIAKEPIGGSESSDQPRKRSGFVDVTKIGLGFDLAGDFSPLLSLTTINGAYVTDFLSLGGGIGFEHGELLGYSFLLVPIFIDARFCSTSGTPTIVGAGDLGYTIGSDVNGGVNIALSIGLRGPLSTSVSWCIDLGYRNQSLGGYGLDLLTLGGGVSF